MLAKPALLGKKGLVSLSNFCGVNTPTMADFELPMIQRSDSLKPRGLALTTACGPSVNPPRVSFCMMTNSSWGMARVYAPRKFSSRELTLPIYNFRNSCSKEPAGTGLPPWLCQDHSAFPTFPIPHLHLICTPPMFTVLLLGTEVKAKLSLPHR